MVNTHVRVNVPGRSGFDKSFKNILTTKVGVITPLLSRLCIPGSKGSLKIAISAALPPLASDTFMRADLKVEAFLVPLRLLYGGFESWLTGKKLMDYHTAAEKLAALPRLKEAAGSSHPYLAPGSLADYLGIRTDHTQTTLSDEYFNVFKFLAYHRCYDDWYRNARVSTPVFAPPIDLTQGSHPLSACPFMASDSIVDYTFINQFNDGVHLGDLRHRNYGDDYFTVATPSAQVGSPQTVSVSTSFSIAALRAANSLQQYAERSNLASPRLQDYVKAHYGADLSSGVAQRSILLGSASYPVYSKGVEANSGVTATNNPFSSVGARYGNAFASGTDFVCEYECNEPSYLLVLCTLVPQANYSSGIERECFMFTQAGSQTDIPDPLLENVGNEPIYDAELTGAMAGNPSGVVFGYVPRYTWYKAAQNTVHGLLRSGGSLDAFVAQRYFAPSTPVSISTNFLQIPSTALDNVTAVTADMSNYGVWIDSFIDYKTSEPLVESAMPSLQDPAYEHGHSVVLKRNGSNI